MNYKYYLLVVIFSLCAACSSGDYALEVPSKAPYTRFQLMSGEYVPLAAYEGKVVTILFWGTWCSSAKSELPELAELAQEMTGQRGVQFIAVSLDALEDADEVQAKIDSLKSSSIVHAFSGNEGQDEAYASFKGEKVPLVLVIDEKGMLVAKGRDIDTARDYLEERGLLR